MNVEQLDRVAEEVFRNLNEVVTGRVPMNSNPGRSSCCPSSTASPPRRPYPGPPGAMANVGIAGAPHLVNTVFFFALGARIPRIPIEGGAPRPSTGGLPPNETPLSLYVT